MKIGLDAHILGKGKGGVERVVYHTLEQLPALLPEHEFIVFIDHGYSPPFPPRSNVRYVPLRVSDPLIQRSIVLPWLAFRWKLDLLHVQRIAPPWVDCPVVVTIHDILTLTAPEDHPGLRDQVVRWLTPASARTAATVITVSHTVREELIQLFRLAPEKVVAVYNGVDHERFAVAASSQADSVPPKARSGENTPVEEEFILYMGAIAPRKNLLVLIRGFQEFLKRRSSAYKLVLAGLVRSEGYRLEVMKLIHDLGIENQVILTGFIFDDDYLQLLTKSRIFLAPSKGEGFDLPPLEAMACGVPVLSSDIPVHREILGEAALFFDPADYSDLAEKMEQICDDEILSDRLRQRGLALAQNFTWSRMAAGLAGVYRQLVEGG